MNVLPLIKQRYWKMEDYYNNKKFQELSSAVDSFDTMLTPEEKNKFHAYIDERTQLLDKASQELQERYKTAFKSFSTTAIRDTLIEERLLKMLDDYFKDILRFIDTMIKKHDKGMRTS